MNRKDLKVVLLKEILKHKNVLFGAFSPVITKDMKNAEWTEIYNMALSLGLAPAGKEYTYTRDVVWQNIKKASMKKRDNSRQTGSAGGPGSKFTQIDEFVYQIIGKDSVVLDGIEVEESVPSFYNTTTSSSSSTAPPPLPPHPPAAASSSKPHLKSKNKRNETMKDKKLKLVIRYLQLKIKKMERELRANTGTGAELVEAEVGVDADAMDYDEEYLDSDTE